MESKIQSASFGLRGTITAYLGAYDEPRVSWASIGSVSLDGAEKYAHDILKAVEWARQQTTQQIKDQAQVSDSSNSDETTS
ncbi:hypothetical protein ACQ4M3_35250 [Leptolyngbya sp. AN03gr2]|uniref:hypothetical protein n=1 Tax=unclassified Leptolyngbya TaxID=2650499 RepID=UPI003D314BFE